MCTPTHAPFNAHMQCRGVASNGRAVAPSQQTAAACSKAARHQHRDVHLSAAAQQRSLFGQGATRAHTSRTCPTCHCEPVPSRHGAQPGVQVSQLNQRSALQPPETPPILRCGWPGGRHWPCCCFVSRSVTAHLTMEFARPRGASPARTGGCSRSRLSLQGGMLFLQPSACLCVNLALRDTSATVALRGVPRRTAPPRRFHFRANVERNVGARPTLRSTLALLRRRSARAKANVALDVGGAQKKKGAPHTHVFLLPMHTPSYSGCVFANEASTGVLRQR